MLRLLPVAALLGLAAAAPLPPVTAVPGFADIAALTLAAPVIVRATIGKAERLNERDAPGVAAGSARLLVTAKLDAALVAPGAVPAEISYLVEVPLDAKGRAAKLKGAIVLLFLRPGERAGQFALAGALGQVAANPVVETAVRGIVADARSGGAPVVTGIGNAFHVPGSVPGEAESQFFLTTADARPVSLVVLSRPGQVKTLTLALGDVIDDSAAPVKPGTLLWYRLACFLPKTLPAGGDDRAALAEDYAFVLSSLGPCNRAS